MCLQEQNNKKDPSSSSALILNMSLSSGLSFVAELHLALSVAQQYLEQ
jgi:hypothetical protein